MSLSPAIKLILPGLLLLAAQPGYCEEAPAESSAPAAPTPPPMPAEPRYLQLEQLRSFYKLLPQPNSGGGTLRTVANAGTTISFGPGKREVNIGGYRWLLSYPIREDGSGDILISEVDAVKIFDPVLRPTYIADRRVVRTVIIDPGHGGYDAGSTSGNLNEAEFCLTLAKELKEALTRRGYNVQLTHEHSRHMSDRQRINCVSSADSPIFISLHLNSGRSDIQGIETYTATPDGPGNTRRPANNHDAASAALAFAVHSSMISTTGAKDGACRRARYSLLNSVECPSIMVLAGYATNTEEAAKLATPDYRTQLATAITEGVCTFARNINPDAKLEPAPEVAPEPATPEPVAAPAPPAPARANNTSRNRSRANRNRNSRNSASRSSRSSRNSSRSSSRSRRNRRR